MNINQWLNSAKNKASIVVYLEDRLNTDTVQREDFIKKIKLLPQVESTRFVSKNDAWNIFESLYGKEMLESIDENPLPPSVEITLKNISLNTVEIDLLESELNQMNGVDGIQYSREWLTYLKKFQVRFIIITFVIGLILLMVLNFMIANTIKLTIYARKDLITNMHYVGATGFYIKTPFILEGILQGMIGSLMSLFGIWIVKISLFQYSLYWGEWYFFPAIFILGILFGCIGSMSAVRKFLV
jgi:cell division transport system permease protein